MKITPRLQSILAYIADCDPTTKEIAEKFSIAQSTARHHEQRLREITRQKSRVGLVIYFYKNIVLFQ